MRLLIFFLSNITYSQKMSAWKGKMITYKKAVSMVKEFEGKKIRFDSLKSDDVYVLNDQRVLLVSEILEEGVLYPNKASLYKTLNSEIVDADFDEVINCVPDNIQRLSELTGIKLSVSDGKEKLRLIDELIHKEGDIAINTYITPVSSYFGQVIANETNGVWKYTKKEGEERIYIESDKEQYYFYHYLIDMLIEGVNERFSFEGLYESIVNPIKFKSFDNLRTDN